MKKRFFTFPLVGAFMLASTGNSFAQAGPGTSEKPEQRMEEKGTPGRSERGKNTKEATGEVTSVDAKGGKLAVKVKDKELSLDAKGSAKKSLDKIHVGDKVTVSYTEKNGQLVAQSVVTKAGEERDKETSRAKKK